MGEAGDGLSEVSHQRPHAFGGARQTAVLRDDRVDRHLERTPGTRYADSRPRAHERTDRRIVGEMQHGGPDIGIESHHPAHSLHDVNHPFPVRQVGAKQQMVFTPGVHFQHTRRAVQADRATIDPVLDRLHARHRPVSEERNDAVPVERRLEREAHRQPTVRDKPISSTPTVGAIELTQTPEPGRERHIRDGQL